MRQVSAPRTERQQTIAARAALRDAGAAFREVAVLLSDYRGDAVNYAAAVKTSAILLERICKGRLFRDNAILDDKESLKPYVVSFNWAFRDVPRLDLSGNSNPWDYARDNLAIACRNLECTMNTAAESIQIHHWRSYWASATGVSQHAQSVLRTVQELVRMRPKARKETDLRLGRLPAPP